MSHLPSGIKPQHYAIVLAGGDGTRLKSLTRRIAGQDLPKQFCCVMGSKTLLEETLERVSLVVPADRILSVVNRAHECFYAPLFGTTSKNLVAQPRNRGTAPAILYALLRVAETAPAAAVAIFPSDHYLSDAKGFMRHVATAFKAVEERPELTVMLGITPDGPEQSYGWIEPGSEVRSSVPIFTVGRFVEKPNADLAFKLWREGALWNSFVMVARASTLIGAFMIALPGLYVSFASIRPTFGTVFEKPTIERLYADLASSDFSQDVLEKWQANLAVLPVSRVGWSDLGDPRRVTETWTRAGIHPLHAA
jgi:mannose-1-phosphate guanylyltransferase